MKEGDADAAREYAAQRAALLAEFPTHLPLLQEGLQRADAVKEPPAARAAQVDAVVAAADAVVAAIDRSALAVALLAVKGDPDSCPAAVRAKKDAEEKKAALADALTRKCLALADGIAEGGAASLEPEAAAASATARHEALEAAFVELRKWADVVEPAKVSSVGSLHAAIPCVL